MSTHQPIPRTTTECFDVLTAEFRTIDPAVVYNILHQCQEDHPATALDQARGILKDIAPPEHHTDAVPAEALEQRPQQQRLPSPLRMRVQDASRRYPLLHEDTIAQICTAYAQRQAESVLQEAHQHLVSERTQVLLHSVYNSGCTVSSGQCARHVAATQAGRVEHEHQCQDPHHGQRHQAAVRRGCTL